MIALDIIDREHAYVAPCIAYRRFDVSSAEMWGAVVAELERVDILVNAAGITQPARVSHDLALAEGGWIIDVKQTGTLLGMRR